MNLFIILAIIILLIIGLISEEVILAIQNSKDNDIDGTFIKCSHGLIHVISKGLGRTTVVFTSSYCVPSPQIDYYLLQNEVSKFTKTAIYERYGYGFSSDTNKEVPIDTLVDDIRLALRKASLNPPYIFVAHSMASLEILRYAQLYPKEIRGIVLEEGLNPEFKDKIPLPSLMVLRLFQFVKYIGLYRLLLAFPYIKNKYINSNLTSYLNKMKLRLIVKNMWSQNMINEIKNFKKNCTIILNDGINFDNLPLKILTSENREFFSKNLNDAWMESQKNMEKFSSKSSQIIIENSDHYIHDKNNDIILSVIKSILH